MIVTLWPRVGLIRAVASIHWIPPSAMSGFVALAGGLAAIAITRGHFDPDYFWHLAVGRRILETQAVPTADPFSFTWYGGSWIADQWLGELLIAALASLGDGAVLLATFGVVAALGPVLIAWAARRGAISVRDVMIVTLIAAILVPQVTARPQVLSFALAGAVLALLLAAGRENVGRMWLLPPIFLVWANVHGYFLVGLGVMACYALFTFLGQTPLSSRRTRVAVVAACCLVASAVTPQGIVGLSYAASFLDTTDFGSRAIAEWQSPDFHSPQFWAFFVLICVALLGGMQRAPSWTLVLAIGGIGAGLFAARAIGIGAILAMPALLLSIESPAPSIGGPDRRARAWMQLGAALAGASIVLGSALARGPINVDERRVPVAAVARLAELIPAPRVLADYSWGGYVISELAETGGRVFVDGRMHKYAPDVLADYVRIVAAEPGWRGLVARYGVDSILLPPTAVLVQGAAQAAGWCEAFHDRHAVILLQACP